jgi:hypothetical protein
MRTRRHPEAGFALLFIYAMAATVAVMLYLELPRVAFEAQRDKEQLLIDRGEQYSRAIGLYVRKFNRYPADFDALEKTQNLRFLRHRYMDPMTGKDEWRVIHVGPGGVFTDSLLYTKKKDDKKSEAQNFITELQQTGGNQTPTNQQGVNLATRQRPSDQPGAPGDPNNPANNAPPPNVYNPGTGPNDPNAPPPPPPQPPNNTNNGLVQVLPDGRIVPIIQGQQPGQQPGQPPGVNVQPGAFQGAIPGQGPVGNPTAAANLINQLLTTPRPGGFPGQQPTEQPRVDQFGNPMPAQIQQQNSTQVGFGQQPGTPQPSVQAAPQQPQQQVIGGGIAGVATKLEQNGIKVYRDRSAYNEWEFVYDLTKDATRAGAAQQQQAAAQGQQQQQGIQQQPLGQQQQQPLQQPQIQK